MRELVELVARITELERRFASAFRHGTVEQVDAEKHLVRVRLGEPGESGGQAFLGPWVPYAQIAGALKVHTPPSQGQQMTMLNPTGDFRQAVAIPLTWSDQNKSPSDKADEHVLTFGDVKIVLKKDNIKFTIGDKHTIEMTKDGTKFTASDHVANISKDGTLFEKAKVTHDDIRIDKTHRHKDVEPGAGLSGTPNEG